MNSLTAGSQAESSVVAASVRDFSSMGTTKKQKFFQSMWQEYHICPGVCVSAFDASLPEGFSFDYSKGNRFIDFGFFLEGGFVNDIKGSALGRLDIENRPGEGGMGFFREMTGTVTIPAREKTRIVHVHVLPDVLHEMLQHDMGTVNPELRRVLEQGDAVDFFSRRCMTPMVQAVANELFFGVRNNFGVRMYMQGKVLELLGLFLMEEPCPADRKGGALCPRERDIIHAIRNELEQEYASPPTMAEIAAKHHMGIPKIQAGFKAMFGMSVFAFIKEYRLQKAKMLFDEGNMNVSEVAWVIGYINLSHFGTAFRKRFGVLPKTYLKSIRAKVHGHDLARA